MPAKDHMPWPPGPSQGTDPEIIEHQEDPLRSALSHDSRLPKLEGDESPLAQRLELSASTAAKMMKAAFHGQIALNKTHLFECLDEKGQVVRPDPITWKDGVSIQILKRLAAQVKKLEEVDLGDDESPLDREVKIATILSAMTKHQAIMEQQVAKAVGLSTKAQQEASKLQHSMQVHKDKMDLLRDNEMSAADVERIANG